MIEYFIIFLVMLACVIVGILIGMLCEKKAQDKVERERYRPLRNTPVEVDLDDGNFRNANTAGSAPEGMTPTPEPVAAQSSQQAHNNNASPLSKKVDPEFADELGRAEMEALEKKMRHQDASFNTLNSINEDL